MFAWMSIFLLLSGHMLRDATRNRRRAKKNAKTDQPHAVREGAGTFFANLHETHVDAFADSDGSVVLDLTKIWGEPFG